MSEELNLVEILKDCLKGTKLYSPICGEVVFDSITNDPEYPIKVFGGENRCLSFTKRGLFFIDAPNGECMLFPCKEYRDWSKFKPKKPKFDPKTLMPFDRVLTKHIGHDWRCGLFSHCKETNGIIDSYCINEGYIYRYCIPYNDDTKHLVGTYDKAPEYYRYWEE